MFKQSRIFFSATLSVILLVSTLIFSSPLKAEACPESPESLSSLYMESEVVVLAEVRNEKYLEITDESEDGFSAEIERNLDIIETFKGENLREIVFTRSEYREKETPVENSDIEYGTNGYFSRNGVYRLTAGKRYLFFMAKNADTGQYELSNYQGIRSIGNNSENIYKDRLAELKAILNNKENQSANFAEWLVRLIEDPETVWDGSYVLSNSFYSLEYEQQDPENAEPVSDDEEFNTYSSKIAKSLSASQKERISRVLYKSLENAVYQDGDSNEIADYNLVRIVRIWDKSHLAMYAFSLLQTVSRDDSGKMIKLMDFVIAVVGDQELYDILDKYRQTVYQLNSAETIEDSAVPVEEEPVSAAVPELAENISIQTGESETAEIARPEINETVIETDVVAEDAQTEDQTPKLTPAQLREEIFGDFVNRYQILLSQNFEPVSSYSISDVL